MENRPYLLFPKPSTTKKAKKGSAIQKITYPSLKRQKERIDPLMQQIEDSINKIQTNPSGILPESVLIFEIRGYIDDFFTAVKNIQEMEWLVEWEKLNVLPDNDFFSPDNQGGNSKKQLNARLYSIWTNKKAKKKLIAMWKKYKKNPDKKFEQGRNKWRTLFKCLYDVREWSEQDRLLETGVLDYWNEKVESVKEEQTKDKIKFEIELWFRKDINLREKAKKNITDLVKKIKGTIIKQCIIKEIHYHGLLCELPLDEIENIISSWQDGNNNDVKLIKCQDIQFFRPVCQAIYTSTTEEFSSENLETPEPPPNEEPIVALLDGLPIENHNYLKDYIIIDDPDDWADEYEAYNRRHGTAMASLIIHGDLSSDSDPLERPIYIRPILKPDLESFLNPKPEIIPESELKVDLLHNAIIRILGTNSENPGEMPSIKIINLSIGDPNERFIYSMSPWARLIDWLAWKYKILIIVSAGNNLGDIELPFNRNELDSLSSESIMKESLKTIRQNIRNHRIMSPSEAINVITIGSGHKDESDIPEEQFGDRINIFNKQMIYSPFSSLGLGYRKSIKPDLIFPGGRILYRRKYSNRNPRLELEMVRAKTKPGQMVACPSRESGELSKTYFERGTSNSAAMATRTAAQIYENLEYLNQEEYPGKIPEEYYSVIMKTLLVHNAYWPKETYEIFEQAFRDDSGSLRELVSRFIGYGLVNTEQIHFCTDKRATLIGFASLKSNEAHEYNFPFPDELSSEKIWKRFIVTLSWLTPISPDNQKYRDIELWFNKPKGFEDMLDIDTYGVDAKPKFRGTIQHHVYEGTKRKVFSNNSNITIQVNARNDAAKDNKLTSVPYCIAVTLEVKEDINVYQTIKERVAERIRPQLRV